MKIIDLSYTIDENCMTCQAPWHETVSLRPLGKIHEVGRNTSSIRLGSHTGTHMDAPLHFFDGAEGIDDADLERICGDCQVVDMTAKNSGSTVTAEDIEKLRITERMLFRFDWHRHWQTDQFYRDFPYFTVEAARMLIDGGMRVIALDTPSPDTGAAINKMDDSPVHKLFLKQGVTIIEYLTNTDALDMKKNYRLVALPLKLRHCDGSPARVIMVEEC